MIAASAAIPTFPGLWRPQRPRPIWRPPTPLLPARRRSWWQLPTFWTAGKEQEKANGKACTNAGGKYLENSDTDTICGCECVCPESSSAVVTFADVAVCAIECMSGLGTFSGTYTLPFNGTPDFSCQFEYTAPYTGIVFGCDACPTDMLDVFLYYDAVPNLWNLSAAIFSSTACCFAALSEAVFHQTVRYLFIGAWHPTSICAPIDRTVGNVAACAESSTLCYDQFGNGNAGHGGTGHVTL